MKIAVLTQPLGHNYGGLLQAYALQTYLKSLGCDVETLDRRSQENHFTPLKVYLLNVARLALGRIETIPTARKQALVLRNLTEFRDHKLAMSPTITSEQQIREYFRTRRFDAFIVGSDQVWRPKYSPSIFNYYLDFLDDIKSPAKRIAYAASFGVKDWEYSGELTEKCKVLVQKFDAVSVRESSAVDLCEDKFCSAANWVVDPTLLLEPSDYDPLINDCSDNSRAECVISYVLDPAPEKRSIAEMVGKSLGIEVFSIKPEHTITQVRANELKKCKLPSVEEWLCVFHDASFVVTDSFHGAVFSILFNKPFLAVGNSIRGMARFESLLLQFGLTERLVDTPGDVSSGLIYSKIDWAKVNNKRKLLAVEGQKFLKTHLNCK